MIPLCWLLLASLVATSSVLLGETQPTHVAVVFASQQIRPTAGLPKEARGAGVVMKSDDSTDGGRFRARFGIVADHSDHGPLSKLVSKQIASLSVTYRDPDRFTTAKETEAFLRELLLSSSGSTFTYEAWSQMLGKPILTADVVHLSGKPGRLLLWGEKKKGYFVYRDGNEKWWFGTHSRK